MTEKMAEHCLDCLQDSDTNDVINVLPKQIKTLVILDVARCYLWLFTLYINTKTGKNSC